MIKNEHMNLNMHMPPYLCQLIKITSDLTNSSMKLVWLSRNIVH